MTAKSTLLTGAAIAVWTLGGISSALAQGPPPPGGGPSGPPPGGGGGGGGGGGERPPGGPGGEGGGSLRDLGKAADRFEAWKIAKLEGAQSFSKYDEKVRADYEVLLEKIEKATLEDRLSGSDARELIMKALKINEVAAAGGATVEEQLVALEASFDAAITDDANADTLMPALNKLQWLISETLIYGSESEELSDAKVSSINKKLIALEEKEEKAKEDGKLTDLERKRLEAGASKIWQLMVKGLKGRKD